MALYRRAGQAPGIDTSPPLDACDPDDLPPCTPRAGLILQQILLMPNHASYLHEWLELAFRAGQRLTEEYLPLLLTKFERRAELPEHFSDVLGKRGRWLARQNSQWEYAILLEDNPNIKQPPKTPANKEADLRRTIEEARQSRSMSKAFAVLVQPEPIAYSWSRALTLAAIDTIRVILPEQSTFDLDLLIVNLPRLVTQFSPTCVLELQTLAAVENKNKYKWGYTVKQAATTLEFRLNMHREFAR